MGYHSPLVSIILPTYNGKAEWITQSIQSVLNQTYDSFELIIINDASTNDIEQTILQFVEKDERIRYYKNESNLQLTDTLNKGISLSSGSYIARIDDDDIWCDGDKLRKQVEFMEANMDCGLCGTCVINIDQSGAGFSRTRVPENDNEIRSRLMRFNQFAHASVIMRKDICKEVGLYNPDWNGAEDYEYWLRIGTQYKLHNIQDYCIQYRSNPDGVSAKQKRKQGLFGIAIAYKYRNHYTGFYNYLLPRLLYMILPSSISKYLIFLFNKRQ